MTSDSFTGGTLTVGGNNESTTYGGAICGAANVTNPGELIKVGTGTLTITNMNTQYYYSVPALVSAGTLLLGDGTNDGSIGGNITNNATLIFNSTIDQTFSYAIKGSGALTKTGPARSSSTAPPRRVIRRQTVPTPEERSFRPARSISLQTRTSAPCRAPPRQTSLSAAVRALQWGMPFDLNANRQVSIGSGATASFDIADMYYTNPYNLVAGTATVAGNISGSGNLRKTGAGLLSLTGTNSYAGNTIVDAGILLAPNTSSLPGYNTAGKVVVNNNGTLAVSFGGTGTWTLADVDTLRAKAIFNDGGSLGFNVTDPSGSPSTGAQSAAIWDLPKSVSGCWCFPRPSRTPARPPSTPESWFLTAETIACPPTRRSESDRHITAVQSKSDHYLSQQLHELWLQFK